MAQSRGDVRILAAAESQAEIARLGVCGIHNEDIEAATRCHPKGLTWSAPVMLPLRELNTWPYNPPVGAGARRAALTTLCSCLVCGGVTKRGGYLRNWGMWMLGYVLCGFIGIAGAGLVILWLWALADAWTNCAGSERVAWLLVLLLGNIPAAIAYYFARRTQQDVIAGRLRR